MEEKLKKHRKSPSSVSHKLVDRTGQRFGRIVVVEYVRGFQKSRGKWKCICDCGKTTMVDSSNLLGLRSCGCLNKELMSQRKRTHGLSNHAGGTYNRLYAIWRTMKVRCLKTTAKAYANYGARGITICDEWMNYQTFHDWAMNNGYADNLTIERLENDLGYYPENCIWATTEIQNRNKRGVRKITYKGETMCMAEWARKIGISEFMLSKRLKNLSVEDALNIK